MSISQCKKGTLDQAEKKHVNLSQAFVVHNFTCIINLNNHVSYQILHHNKALFSFTSDKAIQESYMNKIQY